MYHTLRCVALRVAVAVPALLVVAGCAGPAAPPIPPAVATPDTAAPPVASTADAEVTATVDQVLATALHPGLTWGTIPDVVPALKPQYDAEADRLLWFDGDRPGPLVDVTLGDAGRGRRLRPRRWRLRRGAARRAVEGAEVRRRLRPRARPLRSGPQRRRGADDEGGARRPRRSGDHAVGLRRHRQAARSDQGAHRRASGTRPGRRPGSAAAAVSALPAGPPHGRHLPRPGQGRRTAGGARTGRGVRKIEPGTAWAGVAPLAARLQRSAICRPMPRFQRPTR